MKAVKVHTKLVPDLAALAHIDKAYLERIVDRSLRRLRVERLDLGPADTYTQVAGVLAGETETDLADACNAIRQYKNNGTAAELVDTDGASWPVSIIESFRTSGRSTYAPSWGWTRNYEARVLHLGIDPTGDGEPTTP